MITHFIIHGHASSYQVCLFYKVGETQKRVQNNEYYISHTAAGPHLSSNKFPSVVGSFNSKAGHISLNSIYFLAVYVAALNYEHRQ